MAHHPSKTPKLLASFMIFVGLVDIYTGLFFSFQFPWLLTLERYTNFTQTPYSQHSSDVVTILIGLALLSLGRGLFKQYQPAFYWSIFFVSLSLLKSFIPHFVWHTALVSSLYLICLILNRRHFHRSGKNPMTYQRAVAWLSILFTLCYGVIGSYLLRDQFSGLDSWIDALYYTIETYSTVGYGDITPLSNTAKLFTISMIGLGIATFLTALTILISPMIKRNLKGVYKMFAQLSVMEQHIILCGDSLLTRSIAQRCKRLEKPYLFLESSLTKIQALEAEGFHVGHLNPMDALQLKKINLQKALCLISGYNEDADNLLMMMSARSFLDAYPNSNVPLVARIDHPYNVDKATRAGAARVISPLQMGAEWIFTQIIDPR